jgi:hypothetical protein
VTGNILGYGADPTGTSDSTPAILAALAATGNAYVPVGTYLINSEITLAEKQSITGEARLSILKMGADNIDGIVCAGNYCRVSGINVDGDGHTTHSGIVVLSAHNQVTNCVVSNMLGVVGHGICLDGQSTTCRENLISENSIIVVGGIGISHNGAYNSRIIGNYVQSSGLEGITLDNQAHRCVVSNNRLQNLCLAGGAAAISIDKTELCTITANIINGCTTCGIKTNNNVGTSNSNVIVGNQVIDCVGSAIYLFAGIGGTSSNCMVSGNLIRGASITYSLQFSAGCNYNECRYNQYNGIAVSDSGTGNAY